MLPLRRVVAFALDVALLAVGLLLFQGLLVLLTQGMPGRLQESWSVYLWLVVTVSLPIWCYFILFELWPPHATLGKKVMNLEVFSASEKPIGTTRAARRTTIKVLPTWELLLASLMLPMPLWTSQEPRYSFLVTMVFLIINGLIFFFSGGHRSLHDWLAKTRVDFMPSQK